MKLILLFLVLYFEEYTARYSLDHLLPQNPKQIEHVVVPSGSREWVSTFTLIVLLH